MSLVCLNPVYHLCNELLAIKSLIYNAEFAFLGYKDLQGAVTKKWGHRMGIGERVMNLIWGGLGRQLASLILREKHSKTKGTACAKQGGIKIAGA